MRVYISGAISCVKHADKLFARAEEKLESLIATIQQEVENGTEKE